MIASLQNHQVIAVDQVHEPVLVVNSARPAALENVPQLLGFPDPAKGISLRHLNQPLNPPERRPVGCLPMEVVFPTARCEDEPHSKLLVLDALAGPGLGEALE